VPRSTPIAARRLRLVRRLRGRLALTLLGLDLGSATACEPTEQLHKRVLLLSPLHERS
jgi:hypothetical protein